MRCKEDNNVNTTTTTITVNNNFNFVGRLFGEKMRHFHILLGYSSLEGDVKLFGKNDQFTALIPT